MYTPQRLPSMRRVVDYVAVSDLRQIDAIHLSRHLLLRQALGHYSAFDVTGSTARNGAVTARKGHDSDLGNS